MRQLFFAALVAGTAVPTAAAEYSVDGQITIAKDAYGNETVALHDFGTINSTAAVAPASGSLTVDPLNGGTLTANFTGYGFGQVGGLLTYYISATGQPGAKVPVIVKTHGATTATGDMGSYASVRVGSVYANGGGGGEGGIGGLGGGEMGDYPFEIFANTCTGAEAPCAPDQGQAGWSIAAQTIYLVPNRVYPVMLSVFLQQKDSADGYGKGYAMVDPVFTLAPGVMGYTLTNSLTVPEPATWALFVAGFGAVGVARRRRVAAAA